MMPFRTRGRLPLVFVIIILASWNLGVSATPRHQSAELGPHPSSVAVGYRLQRLPAQIRYSGSCGVAGSGRNARVVNLRRDRSVRVTVRRTVTGRPAFRDDRTYRLSAGGERRLGCSGHVATSPDQWVSYAVVGAEAL